MARFIKHIMITLWITLSMSACSNSIKNEVENIQNNSISIQYDLFNGNKEYGISLKKDSSIEVNVETKKGELKVEILKDGNYSFYTGTMNDTYSFSVDVEKGDYIIKLSGHNHVGSCELNWNEIEE